MKTLSSSFAGTCVPSIVALDHSGAPLQRIAAGAPPSFSVILEGAVRGRAEQGDGVQMSDWQGCVPFFVGVSGHRDLDPAQMPELERQVRTFLADLRAAAPATPIVILSQLAEGADHLVASIGVDLGCESACVLPLDLTLYRTRFSGDEPRSAFDRLRALSIIFELPGISDYTGDRARGYAAAGEFIAAHATILLALWDGIDSARRGSTADVVRARRKLWPNPVLSAPVYELRVRRLDRPTAGSPRVTTRFEGPDAPAIAPLPGATAALADCSWAAAEAVNAAIVDFLARTHSERRAPEFALLGDQRLTDAIAVLEGIAGVARPGQAAALRNASTEQVSAIGAALAFFVTASVPGQSGLLAAPAVALVVIAIVCAQSLRLERQHRWLDLLATGVRVAICLRIANVGIDCRLRERVRAVLRIDARTDRWVVLALSGLEGWIGNMPVSPGVDNVEFVRRIKCDVAPAPKCPIPSPAALTTPNASGKGPPFEVSAVVALSVGAIVVGTLALQLLMPRTSILPVVYLTTLLSLAVVGRVAWVRRRLVRDAEKRRAGVRQLFAELDAEAAGADGNVRRLAVLSGAEQQRSPP